MGGRDTQITVYVTDERKAELKQRADEEDTSMSGIINDMIDRQLQQDAQDAIASEARAEERIQELISVGTEQMVETAKEIRDMNAKFGAYTIANFELMKQDRSAHVRQEALETGARRIRQDLETGIQEVGEGPSSTGSAEPATDSAATQRPTSDEASDSPDAATDDTPDDVDETTAAPSDAESDEDDGSDLFAKLRSDRE
ncbi:hypothetical protein NDI85_21555 [Halomicroarcula sp. S1AR25-4]|uniref:hypothetical protein n=1 Tax=Haloarcula sp. S1AR25-4 TaxID=2950538 RepID=UPI0028744FD9|nr:hypothetical protein [Halomicroarcula sp. S1AR25-4]MDS0280376.1 hypothetical protein [Halomicroarcula sp. S1AR25-4]